MPFQDFEFISIDFRNHIFISDSDEEQRLSIVDSLFLSQVRRFLQSSEDIYHDIDHWWSHIVIPGILSGERVCNVAFGNEGVIGLAIGKRSTKSAKLCTMKVLERYRGAGVGTRLFETTFGQLGTNSKRIHFTVSDKIQESVGTFFTDYGFNLISWQRDRYLRGHEELIFAAPIHSLRLSLLKQNYRRLFFTEPCKYMTNNSFQENLSNAVLTTGRSAANSLEISCLPEF